MISLQILCFSNRFIEIWMSVKWNSHFFVPPSTELGGPLSVLISRTFYKTHGKVHLICTHSYNIFPLHIRVIRRRAYAQTCPGNFLGFGYINKHHFVGITYIYRIQFVPPVGFWEQPQIPWINSLHLLATAYLYFDGLVQERRNSSALAMELRLSCINP